MACQFPIATVVGSYGYDKYPIGSGYGWRYHPIEQVNLFHFGIDIPAPEGEYVRAAQMGTVTSSRWSTSYGNVVEIQHDNGSSSLYGHMLNRLVDTGDRVRAGEVIGTVGSTGAATGPHLHFELYDASGETIDPTDCYNQSVHDIPYGESFYPESEESNYRRLWPWLVGGGIVLAAGVYIIVERIRDKR